MNDPLLDALRATEERLAGRIYSTVGLPSSVDPDRRLRTKEDIQQEIDDQIKQSDYEAMPEVAKNSAVGRAAFENTRDFVADYTDPRDMTLLSRASVESARALVSAQRWMLRTKAARLWNRQVDRVLGLPEGFVQDAIDGAMTGVIEGVTPPEKYSSKVAAGVGQNTVTIGGAVAGGAAMGSVFGPVGTVVGGFLGGAAAMYPYAEAMAEQQYRSELLRRNLESIAAGGGVEAYDKEIADTYAMQIGLIEGAVEGGSAVLGLGIAKYGGKALMGIGATPKSAGAIRAWAAGSAAGRLTTVAGGIAAQSQVEGLEEVAAEYLGSWRARATGAIPDAETSLSEAFEAYTVGAGVGVIAGGIMTAGATAAEIDRARAEAKAYAVRRSAVEALRKDVEAATATSERALRMTPEERLAQADAWNEQLAAERTEMDRLAGEAEAAAAMVRDTKPGTEDADVARGLLDAATEQFAEAKSRADAIVGQLTALGSVMGEPVISDPMPEMTTDEVLSGRGFKPAAGKRNRAESRTQADLERMNYTVVWYQAEEGDAPPAMYSWRTPETIYLEAGSGLSRRMLLGFAMHEVMHDLQWYDPEMYAAIRESLGDAAIARAAASYIDATPGVDQLVGERARDLAAAAFLFGPMPQGTQAQVADEDALTPEVMSAGLARAESEGVPTAIESGASMLGSPVDRVVARLALAGPNARSAEKAMRMLARRAKARRRLGETETPRPRPGIDVQIDTRRGDQGSQAAVDRVREALEGTARSTVRRRRPDDELEQDDLEQDEQDQDAAAAPPSTRREIADQVVEVDEDGRIQDARRRPPTQYARRFREMTQDSRWRDSPEARTRQPLGRSRLDQVLEDSALIPGRGTKRQMIAAMNKAGVRMQEINWRLGHMLAGIGDEQVISRDDLKQGATINEIDVSFGPAASDLESGQTRYSYKFHNWEGEIGFNGIVDVGGMQSPVGATNAESLIDAIDGITRDLYEGDTFTITIELEHEIVEGDYVDIVDENGDLVESYDENEELKNLSGVVSASFTVGVDGRIEFSSEEADISLDIDFHLQNYETDLADYMDDSATKFFTEIRERWNETITSRDPKWFSQGESMDSVEQAPWGRLITHQYMPAEAYIRDEDPYNDEAMDPGPRYRRFAADYVQTEDAQELAVVLENAPNEKFEYVEPHGLGKNVIAHARVFYKDLSDGPIVFVQEIQSKLAATVARNARRDASVRRRREQMGWDPVESVVPETQRAPFVARPDGRPDDTWLPLTIKGLIEHARRLGVPRIVFANPKDVEQASVGMPADAREVYYDPNRGRIPVAARRVLSQSGLASAGDVVDFNGEIAPLSPMASSSDRLDERRFTIEITPEVKQFLRDNGFVQFARKPLPRPKDKQALQLKHPDSHEDVISPRRPTAQSSYEDPNVEMLQIGLEDVLWNGNPRRLAAYGERKIAIDAQAKLIRSYPTFPRSVSTRSARRTFEWLRDFSAENIEYTYNLAMEYDELMAERSKLWYPKANERIVRPWAERYGVPQRVVAGVLARLSPNMNWHRNVSIAERTLDIYTYRQDHPWTAEMEEASKQFAATRFGTQIAAIRGRRLSELTTPRQKAAWIRAYDLAYHDQTINVMAPEGVFLARTMKNTWQSLVNSEKAIAIIESQDLETISENLGKDHKIRSFYNNLLDPASLDEHVTVDTHAVAVGLFSPLSQARIEVSNNFGGDGSLGSDIIGQSGTYGIFADSYRIVAKRVGRMPLQLQSITWEAIRTIFPDKWKTDANREQVDRIWKEYKNGRISADMAREQVLDVAGGMGNPDWYVPGVRVPEELGLSSYSRGVYQDARARAAARGDGRLGGLLGSRTGAMVVRSEEAAGRDRGEPADGLPDQPGQMGRPAGGGATGVPGRGGEGPAELRLSDRPASAFVPGLGIVEPFAPQWARIRNASGRIRVAHSAYIESLASMLRTGIPAPSMEVGPIESPVEWGQSGKVTLFLSPEAAERLLPGNTWRNDAYTRRHPRTRIGGSARRRASRYWASMLDFTWDIVKQTGASGNTDVMTYAAWAHQEMQNISTTPSLSDVLRVFSDPRVASMAKLWMIVQAGGRLGDPDAAMQAIRQYSFQNRDAFESMVNQAMPDDRFFGAMFSMFSVARHEFEDGDRYDIEWTAEYIGGPDSVAEEKQGIGFEAAVALSANAFASIEEIKQAASEVYVIVGGADPAFVSARDQWERSHDNLNEAVLNASADATGSSLNGPNVPNQRRLVAKFVRDNGWQALTDVAVADVLSKASQLSQNLQPDMRDALLANEEFSRAVQDLRSAYKMIETQVVPRYMEAKPPAVIPFGPGGFTHARMVTDSYGDLKPMQQMFKSQLERRGVVVETTLTRDLGTNVTPPPREVQFARRIPRTREVVEAVSSEVSRIEREMSPDYRGMMGTIPVEIPGIGWILATGFGGRPFVEGGPTPPRFAYITMNLDALAEALAGQLPSTTVDLSIDEAGRILETPGEILDLLDDAFNLELLRPFNMAAYLEQMEDEGPDPRYDDGDDGSMDLTAEDLAVLLEALSQPSMRLVMPEEDDVQSARRPSGDARRRVRRQVEESLIRTVRDVTEQVSAGDMQAWDASSAVVARLMDKLRETYDRSPAQRAAVQQAYRELAARTVAILPPGIQGKLGLRIARATNWNAIVDAGNVVVARLARADYDSAVDSLRRTRRRLAKRKMPADVREEVERILETAESVVYTGGVKYRSGTVAEYHRMARAADDAVAQAMDEYGRFRADWKASKDMLAERLGMIADDVRDSVRQVAAERKRKKAAGSSAAPVVSSVLDRAAFESADLFSIARELDGRENGPIAGLFNAMRAAESAMLLEQRRMLSHLDDLARRAGYKDLDDLRDRASGRRGPGRTEYRTVVLGGREVRVTLGQMMKLLALDPETVIQIDAGNPIKLGDGVDGPTIENVTMEELHEIQDGNEEILLLVRAAKAYRESEIRVPAFAAFERLKGYTPRMVPGYEPRSRDLTTFDPASVQTADSAVARFAENAGFTKERTATGGSALVVRDFLEDFLSNADGSLRLAYMAEPTRDAWAVLMHPDVRDTISGQIGQKVLDGLRDMLMSGSGMTRRASDPLDAATGLVTQSLLAMNISTWMKVLAGGTVNLMLDMSPADIAAGMVGAMSVEMDRIEALSGYLWARNAQNATDRRSSVRDDSAGGSRLAGGLTQSARSFMAARDNLLLAIRGVLEQDTVSRRDAVKAAARQFAEAWDPEVLGMMDRAVIRIAVAGHLAAVRRERPKMPQADALAEAVRRAERTIRRTQNVSSPLDDSRVVARTKVRSATLSRAVIPFASDPLKSAARLAEGSRNAAVVGAGRWAVTAVANAGVASVVSIIMAAIGSALSGDDEEFEQVLADAKMARATDGTRMAQAAAGEMIGRAGLVGFLARPVFDAGSSLIVDRQAYDPSIGVLLVDVANQGAAEAMNLTRRAASGKDVTPKDIGKTLTAMSQVTGLPAPILRLLLPLLPQDARDAMRADRIYRDLGEVPPAAAEVITRGRRAVSGGDG